MTRIFYICDGKACEHCHPEDCHLTSKIEHAVNFRKGDTKEILKTNELGGLFFDTEDEYVEKYKPVSIPIQWLNNYDRDLANKLIEDYEKTLELVSPFNDD